MPLYEVRSLDAWNGPDGWSVNDSRRVGTCYIALPPAPRDDFNAIVLAALVEDDFLREGVLDAEADGDVIIEDSFDGLLAISALVTDEDETEGSFRPELELVDTNFENLNPNDDPELLTFWEERFTIPASKGNMTPDEHTLQVVLSYYPDGHPDARVPYRNQGPRIGATVLLMHAGRVESEDTIVWDLKQWQKKPLLGYDPLTREELVPRRAAELLVALDRHMENL